MTESKPSITTEVAFDNRAEQSFSLEPLRQVLQKVSEKAWEEKKQNVCEDLGLTNIPYDWGVTGKNILNTYRALDKLYKPTLLRQTPSLPRKEDIDVSSTLKNLSFSLLIELLRENSVWGKVRQNGKDNTPVYKNLDKVISLVCSFENFENPGKLFEEQNLPILQEFLYFSAEYSIFKEWRTIAAELHLACILLCTSDFKKRLSIQSEDQKRMLSILKKTNNHETKDLAVLLPHLVDMSPSELSVSLTERLINTVHSMGPVILRVSRDPNAVLAFLVHGSHVYEDYVKLFSSGMNSLDDFAKKRIKKSTELVLGDLPGVYLPHILIAMTELSDDSKIAQSIIQIWLQRVLSYNKLPSDQSVENFSSFWNSIYPDENIHPDEAAAFVFTHLNNPQIQQYLEETILFKLETQEWH